jgi:hypothetical protein
MKTLLIVFLILFLLSVFFIGILLTSIYIYNNMRGTKMWNYVNKYIITDEDEYLNKK